MPMWKGLLKDNFEVVKNKTLDSKKASVLLLVGLISSFSFISLTKNCFSSAMVFIVEEGLLTKFETGTVSAVFYAVYAFFQMMCGPLTDKWRPDKLITIGLIGAGASNLVIYFNQNYTVMILSWTVNAILQCAVWPSVFKIALNVVADSMREKALVLVNICGSLGGILSFIVASAVSTRWQLNFLISGVGLFIIAILWELCVISLKPYLVENKPHLKDKKTVAFLDDSPDFFKVLFSYGILLLFIISILRSAFDLGLRTLTPTMINESYQALTAKMSTLLSIIVIVAGVAGTFIAGLIYPRYIKNEALAIFLLLLLAFPFMCLLLLVGRINYIAIISFLAITVFLLSLACMFTSSYIAGRFGKWNMGATVAGFVNGGAALGIVLANTLFTAIADRNGWLYTIRVWIFMMLGTILFSLVFLYKWTKFLK